MGADGPSSKSWLFKPKWMLGHLIIVVCVVLFANLAVWQYHRIDERKDVNATVQAQLDAPPVTIEKLDDLNRLVEWRQVKLVGRWDESHPALVRYPIQDGISGYYRLAPFLLSDGAVVVNSGFIPRPEGDQASVPDVGVSEPTTIEGYLRDSERSSDPVDYTAGDPPVPTLTAVNVEALRALMPADVLSSQWVQLSGAAQFASAPKPLPGPDLSEGPHRSYMLQWIAFTILAIVGWIAVLMRTARDRSV